MKKETLRSYYSDSFNQIQITDQVFMGVEKSLVIWKKHVFFYYTLLVRHYRLCSFRNFEYFYRDGRNKEGNACVRAFGMRSYIVYAFGNVHIGIRAISQIFVCYPHWCTLIDLPYLNINKLLSYYSMNMPNKQLITHSSLQLEFETYNITISS